MRTFQQILEAAGYECTAYSGRGMGGDKCLSISLKQDGAMGKLFADVLEEVQGYETVNVAKPFRKMRTDNLGKGIVVYFPGIKFEE